MNNVNLQNLLLILLTLSAPVLTESAEKNLSIKTNNSQDTEADFVPYCPNCRQSNPLSSIPLNIRSCGLVSSSEDVKKARLKQSDISSVILSQQDIEKGKLSDYWAQELIGSDLLREEELKNIPPPERENFISVFDGSDIFHATPIKNLISDEGFQAVLPESKISLFKTRFSEDYPIVAKHLKKKPPAFINNSMGWRESQETYDAFKSLSPPSIIVTASGNFYPRKLESIKDKASKDFDIIIVGSFSPGGSVSHFSEEGEEVQILAPSDDFLSTVGYDGKHETFGATSGAVPLVTASLAGFEWLSGYHPTPEEAKILLEKTAIPTPHIYEKPMRNGVGLVNSYKLGRVGKRLKQKCMDKPPDCFRKEIRKKENYHFPKLKGLQTDLQNAFPECSIKEKAKGTALVGGDCKEKERVFKKLRQAVLLDPDRGDLWKTLSCIYKEGGFSVNGEALDMIANSNSRENIISAMQTFAQTENPIKKRQVIRLAGNIGGQEGTQILDGFSKDSNKYVKGLVAIAAGNLGGQKGDQILDFLSTDPEPFVRNKVAAAAANRGGEEGIRILDALSKDSDKYVKNEVAYGAASIGGKEGIRILKALAEDPDPYVHQDAKRFLNSK